MSNIIVMAVSPWNIVGCLLKKKAYKGGVTGTPGPPSLRPNLQSGVLFSEERERKATRDSAVSRRSVRLKLLL